MAWFEQYDRQVMEYQRCIRLGQAYDRDIDKLDQEAMEKAAAHQSAERKEWTQC